MSGKKNASNQDTELSELVSKHINNLDDKGKLQLPDDMPDWQKHVVRAEKRQRDAQSELGRTQAQLRESKAVTDVLMATASTMVPDDFQLSDDELTALDKLKTTDPDKYRLEVNALEAKAKEAQKEKLAELTTKAATAATDAHTTKNRVTVLAEFRDANPDLVITDDVLVNDVPPRFLKGVQDGEYDYATYLSMVKDYVGTGKKAPEGNEGDPHNIHKMNGSQTPGKKAAGRQGQGDYAKMTF
ncbi:MAG: hypothetical protein DRQ78_12205 [Epsilonproteobacteria bacterium]|nr:MAG: hypothetical protein DRQ78_12205 [Campylobacterota bacterium]